MKSRRKKRAHTLPPVVFIAAGVIALLAIVYLAFGIYFRSHFWFRTTINGMNCSGKTVAEVKQMITKSVDPYTLTITDRSGRSVTISSDEIGLEPEFDGSIEKELASQKSFGWIVSVFRKTKAELETIVSYDKEKLAGIVDHMACVTESALEENKPVDAHISDFVEGTGFSIVPEVEGAQIDRSKLDDAIASCIINLTKELNLDESDCYVSPKVLADDKTLTDTMTKMNAATKAAVTYVFGDEEVVCNGGTFSSWLTYSGDTGFDVDAAQAAAYIASLADQYDTYGKARSFKTTYGATVTLSTNKYGWQIDQETETAQLIEDIKSGTVTSREPAYSHTGKQRTGNDYGNTYVEINLTAQHLYFYVDGALVIESDLISGNEETECDTPPGAFSLSYKQKGAVLRGADYASPVDFWMPFNGNIGMHDASWKSDFGGNYYKYTGSHGCINLPRETAETIFNSIHSGDPIFVYELDGTETEKYWKMIKADEVTYIILEIGDTVTLDSKAAIDKARAAYEALDEEEKGYVRTYDILTSAEETYAKLTAQTAP